MSRIFLNEVMMDHTIRQMCSRSCITSSPWVNMENLKNFSSRWNLESTDCVHDHTNKFEVTERAKEVPPRFYWSRVWQLLWRYCAARATQWRDMEAGRREEHNFSFGRHLLVPNTQTDGFEMRFKIHSVHAWKKSELPGKAIESTLKQSISIESYDRQLQVTTLIYISKGTRGLFGTFRHWDE